DQGTALHRPRRPDGALHQPAGLRAADLVQVGARGSPDSSDVDPEPVHDPGLRADPHRVGHPGVPVVPELDARGHGERRARGRHRVPRGVRPGTAGLPGQEDRVRAHRLHAVRATGHPGHPQLRDRRAAVLARHVAGHHRADGRQRLRGVLPEPVLRQPAARAGGVRLPRRGHPMAGVHQGRAAAVEAGPGDTGPAVLPHQLERLPVAGLRAVQPGEPDPAGGSLHPAVGQQRPLRPAHGRGGGRQRARAAALPARPAVRHRRGLALGAQGL
ncbi:MAG: ABC transporter, permease protein 2 (cluster 1, maltose/g3p/polyamine/iron), partial [uncultured Nocardioidaceae bacterium]